MFCITPLNFGLAILASHANCIIAGEQYLDASFSVFLFALRSIPWAMALILENQIVFVQGYENKLTMFYFIGGGLNLVLNSILATVGITKPEWYILTTIVAELLVIVLDILLINKNKLIDLRKLFIHAGKYVLYSSGFFHYLWIDFLGFVQLKW